MPKIFALFHGAQPVDIRGAFQALHDMMPSQFPSAIRWGLVIVLAIVIGFIINQLRIWSDQLYQIIEKTLAKYFNREDDSP
jgi:hypothetical protein